MKINVFNLIWMCVWSLMAIVTLIGAIMGNSVHYIFCGCCLYLAWLLYTDNEDGESLKEYFTRKFKKSK